MARKKQVYFPADELPKELCDVCVNCARVACSGTCEAYKMAHKLYVKGEKIDLTNIDYGSLRGGTSGDNVGTLINKAHGNSKYSVIAPDGQVVSIGVFARAYGIPYRFAFNRLKKNIPTQAVVDEWKRIADGNDILRNIEDADPKARRDWKHTGYPFQGGRITIREFVDMTHISRGMMWRFLDSGLSLDEIWEQLEKRKEG